MNLLFPRLVLAILSVVASVSSYAPQKPFDMGPNEVQRTVKIYDTFRRCFRPGLCGNIGDKPDGGIIKANSHFECQDACRDNRENCTFFSYKYITKSCGFFKTCPKIMFLGIGGISGPNECLPGKDLSGLCNMRGMCSNDAIFEKDATSKKECYKHCLSVRAPIACQIFTFDPTKERCYFYSHCAKMEHTKCMDCSTYSELCFAIRQGHLKRPNATEPSSNSVKQALHDEDDDDVRSVETSGFRRNRAFFGRHRLHATMEADKNDFF